MSAVSLKGSTLSTPSSMSVVEVACCTKLLAHWMLHSSSKQLTTLDGLANLYEGQHWTAAANGKPDPAGWDDGTL
jgi:hypothetical protein